MTYLARIVRELREHGTSQTAGNSSDAAQTRGNQLGKLIELLGGSERIDPKFYGQKLPSWSRGELDPNGMDEWGTAKISAICFVPQQYLLSSRPLYLAMNRDLCFCFHCL